MFMQTLSTARLARLARIARWAALGLLGIAAAAGSAQETGVSKRVGTSTGALTNPQVRLVTSLGNIDLELFADRAPKTVANFLKYVNRQYYDGLVFHRVIPGFMIQGGGHDVALKEKPNDGPIPNESGNGLRNTVGTISMARLPAPHTAGTQFFINLVDNPALDYHAAPASQEPGWGYAVFGQVVAGMEVVQKIATVPTSRAPNGMGDVPQTPVVIQSARLLGKKS